MSSPEGSSVTFRRVPQDVRPRAIQLFARKLQRDLAKGRPFDTLITGDAELQRLLTEEGFENPRVKLVGERYKEFVARGALKAARQARENQWQQVIK